MNWVSRCMVSSQPTTTKSFWSIHHWSWAQTVYGGPDQYINDIDFFNEQSKGWHIDEKNSQEPRNPYRVLALLQSSQSSHVWHSRTLKFLHLYCPKSILTNETMSSHISFTFSWQLLSFWPLLIFVIAIANVSKDSRVNTFKAGVLVQVLPKYEHVDESSKCYKNTSS